MSSTPPISDLEASVVTLGAIFIMAWGGYRVYRLMRAKNRAKPLAHLAGTIAACLLAVVWIALAVVLFSPDNWLRLSPVVAITLAVFYATWRYTRVQGPVDDIEPSMLRQAWRWSVKRQKESNQKLAADLRALWAQPKQPAQPKPATIAATTVRVSLPALFEFDYSTEDGEISSRRVLVQSTSYSGDRQYLEGICKTRNAHRTFRVDRVIGTMTRVDDGEQIRASQLFAVSTPKPAAVFTASSSLGAPKKKRDWETAVFFAGFGAAKRSELEELAEAAGWQVRTSITKTVDYVVTGSIAGGGQLAKAEELGIDVLDEDGFRRVI